MKNRNNDSKTIYGVTWLTREEWHKMRAVASDPFTLASTYEDWMLMAWRVIKDAEQKGNKVKKVNVAADIFAEWCANNDKSPDNAARSEYVSYLMATEKALRKTKKQEGKKLDNE